MTRVCNKPKTIPKVLVLDEKYAIEYWAFECIFVNRSQNYLFFSTERRINDVLALKGSFVARKISILCGCRVTVIVSCRKTNVKRVVDETTSTRSQRKKMTGNLFLRKSGMATRRH